MYTTKPSGMELAYFVYVLPSALSHDWRSSVDSRSVPLASALVGILEGRNVKAGYFWLTF